MDNMKVKEICRKLQELFRGLDDAPHYTQAELLEIMLNEQNRQLLDDALCKAKGINGRRFKAEQNPQHRAQLLNKAIIYIEAQTLLREIAEEISAE